MAKRKVLEVKRLFKVEPSECPFYNKTGHKAPEIGSHDYDHNLNVVDVCYGKSFYGNNDMYHGWTTMVQLENGRWYHNGVMGLSKTAYALELMSELPPASVAYDYKVSLAIKLQVKFKQTREERPTDFMWSTSNLIEYFTTPELESMIETEQSEEFKTNLLTMHKNHSLLTKITL